MLLAVVATAVALATMAAAQGMPSIFGSRMVLQAAPLSARLWGTVGAGQSVSATLTATAGGAPEPVFVNATADAAGAWSAFLPPVAASKDLVYSLTVRNENSGASVTFTDVLFGDVYLCSGQSNMEMTLPMTLNPDAEIADSVNYPLIRVFSVLKSAQDVPQSDVGTRGPAPWSVASPASLRGGDYDYFSAVCYLFGRELSRELDIPIGLVSSAWGGTIVEAWMSPESLATCARSAGAHSHHAAAGLVTRDPVSMAPRGVKNSAEPNDPSALWNGMIAPIIKYSFKGATWYQGESNAGNPAAYECLFPAMIADWRAKTQPEFGFYFVQLAPYNGGGLLPAIRQAQTVSEGPFQRMAVTIDLWDPSSQYGEIHPRGKAPVAKRLALQALATTYGRNVDAAGPVAVDASAGAGNVVTVVFASRHPSQYVLKGFYDCATSCASTFQVADAAGTWYDAASAVVSGSTVVVTPPGGVASVTGVRYAWTDIPTCGLFDERGLPARPVSLTL